MTGPAPIAVSDKETLAPCASNKLLDGVNEAVLTITQMLKTSAEALDTFQSQWEVLLENYDVDVKGFDEELDKLPLPSYEMQNAKSKETEMKERRRPMDGKRRGRPKIIGAASDRYAIDGEGDGGESSLAGPVANHSLNFHLSENRRAAPDNCEDDMFILPPESDDADKPGDSPGKANESQNPSVAPDESSIASSKTQGTAGRRERRRFETRENMFHKLDLMRDTESQLERRLDGGEGSSAASPDLTERERQDLVVALERCRARHCAEIVEMVSAYKPRFTATTRTNNKDEGPSNRMKRLGLDIQSVEEMMEEVNASVVDDSRTLKGTNAAEDSDESTEGEESSIHSKARKAKKDVLSMQKSDQTKRTSKGAENNDVSSGRPDTDTPPDDAEDCSEREPSKPGLILRTRDEPPAQRAAIMNDPHHFTSIQDLPVVRPETTVERDDLRSVVLLNTHPINPLTTPSSMQSKKQALTTHHTIQSSPANECQPVAVDNSHPLATDTHRSAEKTAAMREITSDRAPFDVPQSDVENGIADGGEGEQVEAEDLMEQTNRGTSETDEGDYESDEFDDDFESDDDG